MIEFICGEWLPDWLADCALMPETIRIPEMLLDNVWKTKGMLLPYKQLIDRIANSRRISIRQLDPIDCGSKIADAGGR